MFVSVSKSWTTTVLTYSLVSVEQFADRNNLFACTIVFKLDIVLQKKKGILLYVFNVFCIFFMLGNE